MENKSSNEYVALLLKQLEELKKKKARKERKLQKLKVSARVDLQHDKISGNSINSFKNMSGHTLNVEKSTHLLNIEESESEPKNENCHSFDDSKCKKNDNIDIKTDKENFCDSSLNSHYNLNEDIIQKSELEMQKCNENIRKDPIHTVNYNRERLVENEPPCKNSIRNESCEAFTNAMHKTSNVIKSNEDNFFNDKHDSSFFANCKLSGTKKSYLEDEQNFTEAVIPNTECCEKPNQDTIETEKDNEEMALDIEALSSVANVMKEDFTSDTSCELKTSNSSNKSLPSSKNKNSDKLDYSLNSNMSCFLSPELFIANDDKKEIMTKDEANIACTVVKLKQAENNSELISLQNPKISFPFVPNLSSNKLQNEFDVFNFPKFSTPTEGIVYQSSDENMNSQEKFERAQACLVFDPIKTASCDIENVHAMNKTFQPENKFDTSQINVILGKGLSSILDAHYKSPQKPIALKDGISSNFTHEKKHSYPEEITCETVKKRKLFLASTYDTLEEKSKLNEDNMELDIKSNNSMHPFYELAEKDKGIVNLDNIDEFPSLSDSFSDLQKSPKKPFTNLCDDISSQVTKTVDGLVTKVCQDSSSANNLIRDEKPVEMCANFSNHITENVKADSELLVIPETEGLEFCSTKDTDFLDTSTLSQNLKDFNTKDNLLNTSSQSRLESPIVNKIVSAVKLAKNSFTLNPHKDVTCNIEKENHSENLPTRTEKIELNEATIAHAISACDNSLCLDTSFLEDDTQELGNYKQVPYMNETNVQKNFSVDVCEKKIESNLNFICSLYGAANEPVIDVEIVVFSHVKYAFIQHRTQIHVWRQEKNKGWIKIFNHQIEDMLSLVRICVTMDEDNLVVVMLLNNDEQYCLQFLLFEKDARVIKLMENTHWLEERHSKDSVLLCGLDGLMFATAQSKENHEISLHAFISLKDNPRLMSTVLGTTDSLLCSLCKIDKLPNALLGVNDSMLYVWHILEARLVTSVSLHPHDYLPIKQCFWATVENGLIYLITTCEDKESHKVCQLLAANLATGFCQSAMTYSTQPSNNTISKITKAVYLEPFLVVAHSKGAVLWSVTEEYCCATLLSKSNVTSIAISKDFENWGLIAVGSKFGYISCYSLN